MARKAKEEEHENLERWLVSYADFITLLFAFFVVMYSISSINEGKYRVLSDSLIAAFHAPNKTLMPIQVGKMTKSPIKEKMKIKQSPFVIKVPEIPLPWTQDEKLKGAGVERYRSRGPVGDKFLEKLANDGQLRLTPRQQAALKKALKGDKNAAGEHDDAVGPDAVAMKKIAADVQRALQKLIDRKLIKVRRNRLWVEVEINDSVLFASGQAEINPKAVHVVKDLAKILAPFPNVVRVEGFTDNVPIDNNVYPSNWELSSARAASVVRLMIAHGIDPQRMLAVGYGKYHPVADNDTAAGRRRNRRVSLVVLAQGASELALNADPANAGQQPRPRLDSAGTPSVPDTPAGHPAPGTGRDGAAAPQAKAASGADAGSKSAPAPAPQPVVSRAQRPAPAAAAPTSPGGSTPMTRAPIPPPIHLAPPIRLPLPIGRAARAPMAVPDAATDKRP